MRKGHNLKVTYEFLEPDDDRGEDQQERYSLVWEYSPIQFVQSRVGFRSYNGIPNFPRDAIATSYSRSCTSTSEVCFYGRRPRTREAGLMCERADAPAASVAQSIAMRFATGSGVFGRRTVSTPSATLAAIASLSIFVESVNVRTKLPTLYSE